MADETAKEPVGAFVSSLQRNNRQIKDDRATAIAEDAQLTYRRNIEDLEMTLKRMHRAQENMLDMSPENTQSLILGKDFDGPGYVEKDTSLALEIRNTEIRLELARDRYKYLFGDLP